MALYTFTVIGVDYNGLAEALEPEELDEAVNTIRKLWPAASITIEVES
jgi:hypothetical protein